MIPYSRPKLYDFYTLSHTYLLENHTLHSKFTAAHIYCMACIWQPWDMHQDTQLLFTGNVAHMVTSTKHRVLFLLPLSPWWDLSNNCSVIQVAVFFPSLPPWGLLSSTQGLGLFIKDAQIDSLTCCWLRGEGTRGTIKFSCWSTAHQHKVPSERAFKMGQMGGGGLTKANVFFWVSPPNYKDMTLEDNKDGIILTRINYKNRSNLKLSQECVFH